MDRLFLDANVLFSAAYKSDTGLLQLWKLKDVVLCSSRYAVEEARINLDDEVQKERLTKLVEAIYLVEPSNQSPRPAVSLPEKELPILLAAIDARATHLLTGDIRHFGRYLGKKLEGIAVTLPGEYLRQRRGGNPN